MKTETTTSSCNHDDLSFQGEDIGEVVELGLVFEVRHREELEVVLSKWPGRIES